MIKERKKDSMRLLDLYCGAGGAAKGYQRAGFYVVGVDINSQPRYCGDEFIQDDAIEYVREYGHTFDAIHASPPCQGYGQSQFVITCKGRNYPKLIDETRQALIDTSSFWVIENVPGAPLKHPLVLCGTSLGLKIRRHRLFESSIFLLSPGPCRHTNNELGIYAGKVTKLGTRKTPYVASTGRTHYRPETMKAKDGQRVMEIDWMTLDEMAEAIPPAYTEFIGRQLIEVIKPLIDWNRARTAEAIPAR